MEDYVCMQKQIKLHLGAGKRIIPGYVNIDIMPGPGIDVLADLRSLPFKRATVDFIYSCAAIEHFGRRQWKVVLKHWYELLVPGGQLRISTADFDSACQRYLKERNVNELLGLIVGGQKDEYDWHGMIFDFASLSDGLEEVGFTCVSRYDWRGTELAELGIDDYSQAYLPHMDKTHGLLMMLNVIALKPAATMERELFSERRERYESRVLH
jgi:predicted SAM-dependent methyltransferase